MSKPLAVPARAKLDALFLSRHDAATVLGVNIQLIDRLIREERLPAARVGRRILISRADLLRTVVENPVWPGARDDSER
jgi:excisionase family DNA binding protein